MILACSDRPESRESTQCYVAGSVMNQQRHGFSFMEAARVFGDPLAITAPDHDHDADEPREITFGLTEQGYVAVVAHVERGGKMRIFIARWVAIWLCWLPMSGPHSRATRR